MEENRGALVLSPACEPEEKRTAGSPRGQAFPFRPSRPLLPPELGREKQAAALHLAFFLHFRLPRFSAQIA
jgi:hypothetical protein